MFDTVYVSLYKNFNAASGAILAGRRDFCEGLYHTRRMFGGSQPSVWPFALVALQYLDSFMGGYQKSLHKAGSLFAKLEESGHYRIEKIPGGTNVQKLHVLKGDPAAIRERLLKHQVQLNRPSRHFKGFMIKINPGLLRVDNDLLIRWFTAASGSW